MDFVNEMVLMLMIRTKALAYDLTHDEEGAVDLVTIVVLIGIAVVLALAFRKSLKSLLDTLMSSITGSATEAVSQ